MTMLEGKVVLVTGAASGIGRSAAEVMVAQGAKVVMTDRNAEGVVEAAAPLGDQVLALAQDVIDEARWAEVIGETEARFGALHGLVNNAGGGIMKGIEEMTLTEWRKVHALNADSVFLGVRAALPLMRKSGRGSIVNVSSVAGMVGDGNLSAYCAAKGSSRMFSKAAALYCAQRGDDIRVNSVHPSFVDTPLVRGMIASSPDPARMEKMLVRSAPVNRLGKVEEVAEVIAFLISDKSTFVTGAEWTVDGGLTSR